MRVGKIISVFLGCDSYGFKAVNIGDQSLFFKRHKRLIKYIHRYDVSCVYGLVKQTADVITTRHLTVVACTVLVFAPYRDL